MAACENGYETKAAGAPRLAMVKMAANSSAEDAVRMEDSSNESGDSISQGFERKLIRNGNITVEVSDLQKASASIDSWVKEFGGYISNSNAGESSVSFTVRIPAEKFDTAMDSYGSLGKVKNKNIYTNDVTEQYYDTQSRLETRKVLRDKLNTYLRQATSMQDMLKIERELNSVQAEIESMEGKLKRLSSEIEYATIYITLNLPYHETQSGFDFPDLGDGFRHFIANLLAFFAGLFTVILYAVICGVPLLALIALLFWLLFGKVGLLIKLYNRLKK